jgi:hypothetical protein
LRKLDTIMAARRAKVMIKAAAGPRRPSAGQS